MKAHILLFSSLLLLAAPVPQASAIEQVIVGWDQDWDYMQPMGTDPVIADTNFNTTWYLKASDFTVNYNGPTFGGPPVVGNPADPNSFDSGTGPGPLGYEAIDYYATGGELSAHGTTLTQPPSGMRYASYYRTNFTAVQLYTSPRIRMLLDDSALVYYDGVLVARVNQSASTETYTYASGDLVATNNESLVSNDGEDVIQSFSLSTTGGSPTADSTVLVALPSITAGTHTIAVSVRSNAATSSDQVMGLELRGDDVGVAITPAVSNIVRSENGTPGNLTDDTVSFTLNVVGTGPVTPAGWRISSPPALAGTTGTYGVNRNITAVPIAEFSGFGHTLDMIVEDSGNPGINAIASVTAPWCALQATISNVARQDLGNADPNDDTWSYSVTVTAQFGGPGWISDNGTIPAGSYGVIQNMTGLSVLGVPNQTIIFTDNADPACTVTFSANAPRIIGTKNFGTAQPLFSDNTGVPANWLVDETALTQFMNNGGGAPPKEYRSEVINLSAVGAVSFSATLQVDDTSSGNEADDNFNAYLIIDGNAAAPVSLITPYDTLAADGVLTGAEITPATPGPPPVTGAGNYTHTLSAAIPAGANSVQLVITGTNNSASEAWTVHSILFTTSTDTDGDGLPDAWETANIGTLAEGAADDHDHDGATNLNEFNAGTHPNNPASIMKIVSVVPAAGGYQLTWTSVPGKIYRVDYSTNMTAWTDLGADIPASAGSTTSVNLPVGPPVPPRLFARIRVKP